MQINITLSTESLCTIITRNTRKLRAACVLLWRQCKVPGSIYFMCDKVVDFQNPVTYKYITML